MVVGAIFVCTWFLNPLCVGFRTFQLQAAVRQIRLTRHEKTEDVPMEYADPSENAPSSAQVRALAELCKLILNLNEFVYVD